MARHATKNRSFVSTSAKVALTGAILGAGTGLALLAHAGHPLPTTSYTLALITGLTLTAAAAATLPAVWAARRDPLTELRIA